MNALSPKETSKDRNDNHKQLRKLTEEAQSNITIDNSVFK